MNETLSTILKNTYSLSQLRHRLNVFKSQLLQDFFGEDRIEPQAADLAWLKSLPLDFIRSFNKDNVYQIFEDLDKEIKSVQTLIIYLTFEPDETSLAQIGDYARKTFNNSELILEIRYDPNLIAGAALSWNGLYRDYSLRAKIEERKLEILESFKKFLR